MRHTFKLKAQQPTPHHIMLEKSKIIANLDSLVIEKFTHLEIYREAYKPRYKVWPQTPENRKRMKKSGLEESPLEFSQLILLHMP